MSGIWNGIKGKEVKTVVCTRLGDAATESNLTTVYRPLSSRPACPPGHVRIKVCAASINFADMLQIAGQYQEKKKPPFVPGSEVSGWVSEVGENVSLSVGDAVCALIPDDGAFQEEVIAPSIAVVKIPATSDVESAAGLPVAFGTAYMGLRKAGMNASGGVLHTSTNNTIVLVLGASGGVGCAAVQLGTVMGAKVICLARGRDKVSFLKKSIGAAICIDSDGLSLDDIKKAVKKHAPNGVDIVFDTVGGPLGILACNSLTAFGGHVVIVGFASGSIQEYKANIALVKNITLHGLYWGAHMKHDPQSFRESLDAVAALFARGDIFVPISRVYPFEQAQQAFQMMKNRSVHHGKMLLIPSAHSNF
jgi:NADPH:quinone reductase